MNNSASYYTSIYQANSIILDYVENVLSFSQKQSKKVNYILLNMFQPGILIKLLVNVETVTCQLAETTTSFYTARSQS